MFLTPVMLHNMTGLQYNLYKSAIPYRAVNPHLELQEATLPPIPSLIFTSTHSPRQRCASDISSRSLPLPQKQVAFFTTLVTIPSYQKALGANLLHETIFSITECNLRLFLYTVTALFHTPHKRKEGGRVMIDRPLFFNTWARRKKTPHSRYLEYLHTRFVSHVTG